MQSLCFWQITGLCLRGNQTSLRFAIGPPALEDYLQLPAKAGGDNFSLESNRHESSLESGTVSVDEALN